MLCLNDFLNGDLCENIFYLHTFLFFMVCKDDFIRSLILPIGLSQLQAQQVMTSLISSHIEYLIKTCHILVLILWSKLMKNLAVIAGFNTI